MDLGEKISLLAGAAKYDASCASSGSGSPHGSGRRRAKKGGFGISTPAGCLLSYPTY
jgi:predicted DNA-binding helix-hairpin-helix protein